MAKIKAKLLREYLLKNNVFNRKGRQVKTAAHSWMDTGKGRKTIRFQVRQNKGEGENKNLSFEFWCNVKDEDIVSVGAELYKKIVGRATKKKSFNFFSKENFKSKQKTKKVSSKIKH